MTGTGTGGDEVRNAIFINDPGPDIEYLLQVLFGHDFLDRAVAIDAFVLDGYDPVGISCRVIQVVKHHDNGDTHVVVHIAYQFEQFKLMRYIKEGGWFVQEQHPGFLGQVQGDPGALALPAGECGNLPVLKLLHSGKIQSPVNDFPVLFPGAPEHVPVWEASVTNQVPDRESGRGVMTLRQDGQFLRQFASAARMNLFAVEIHRTARGFEEASHCFEHG